MALFDGTWAWLKKLWNNTETGYKQYQQASSNQLPGMFWDVFWSKKLSEDMQKQLYGESDKSGIERALLRFSRNTREELSGIPGKPLSTLEDVPILRDILHAYDRLFTYGLKRPIATAMIVPQYGGPFDTETWRKAWNDTEKVTPGQGLAWAFTGNDPKYDPRTPEGRQHYYDDALFQYTSGSLDFALNFVDPLKGAGKATKATLLTAATSKIEPVARAAEKVVSVTGMAPSTKMIQGGYLEREAFGPQAEVGEGFVEAGKNLAPNYQRLFESAKENDLATYQRLHFNDATFGGTVATTSWAFAQMDDPALFADSLLAARGSYDAMQRLQRAAPEAVNRIGRDRAALNLASAMDKYAVDPNAKSAVDNIVKSQFEGWLDNMGRDLENIGEAGIDRESFWDGLAGSLQGQGRIRTHILQKLRVGLHDYVVSYPVSVQKFGRFFGSAARTVGKFVDPSARYDSLINVNSQSSYRNFRYNLDRSTLPADVRNGLMARYMLAASPEERSAVIAATDERTLRHLQKTYGFTDKEYKRLAAEMRTRRNATIDLLAGSPRHIPNEFLKAANTARTAGKNADAKRMTALATQWQKLIAEGKAPEVMHALPVGDRAYLGMAETERGYVGTKPYMRSTTANLMPMMDYRALERQFRREFAPYVRSWKRMVGLAEADPRQHIQDMAKFEFWKRQGQFSAALNAVQKAWAIAALLRPAQFIRSIADDGMRAMVWHGMGPYMMAGLSGAARMPSHITKGLLPRAMLWAKRQDSILRGVHHEIKMPDVDVSEFRFDTPSGLAGKEAGFYQLAPVTASGVKIYKPRHAKAPVEVEFPTLDEALVHGVITPDAYIEAARAAVEAGRAPWGVVQLVQLFDSGFFAEAEFKQRLLENAMDQTGLSAYTNPAWQKDFYAALSQNPTGLIADPKRNRVRLVEPVTETGAPVTPKRKGKPGGPRTPAEIPHNPIIPGEAPEIEGGRVMTPGDLKAHPEGWFPPRDFKPDYEKPIPPGNYVESYMVGRPLAPLPQRGKQIPAPSGDVWFKSGRKAHEKYDFGPVFKIPVDITDGSYRFEDLGEFLSQHASEILEKNYLVHGARTSDGHMVISLVRPRSQKRNVVERMTAQQRIEMQKGMRRIGQGYTHMWLGDTKVRVKNAFAGMVGDWLRSSTGSGTDVTSGVANWLALKTTSRQLVIGERNQSVKFDSKTYPSAWEYTVNKLIANDPVQRQALEGKSYGDVLVWTDSDEGRAWVRSRQQPGVSIEDHVRDLMNMAYRVVPEEGNLRLKALQHDAKFSDFQKVYPFEDGKPNPNMPDVLGPSDLMALGRSGPSEALRSMIDRYFRFMNDKPIDALIRHPFVATEYNKARDAMFDNYRAYLERTGETWTEAELERLENIARQQALDIANKTLFETIGRTDAAAALQLMMPFASAIADSYFKWFRLAWKKPVATTKMWWRFWLAPDKSGLVYDQDGFYLERDEEGNDRWVSPTTGEVAPKFEPDGVTPKRHDKYVLFRLPDVGGKQIYGKPGEFQWAFNKETMNPILSVPTAGPLVAIPANKFLVGQPHIADKWWIKTFVVPFGVTDAPLLQQIAPGPFRVGAKFFTENQDSASSTAMQIYQMQLVEYARGERAAKPSIEEAKQQAKSELGLRWMESLYSPVSLQYYNPYKPYVDYYHMLVDKHNGDEDAAMVEFRQQAGDDYMYLTAHVSKVNYSLPAKMQAYDAFKANEQLARDHPELLGLILGSDGAGSFNQAVYEWEKTLRIKGKPVREVMTISESIDDLNKRATWAEYSKLMDRIDMELEQRNLTSLRSRTALDLAAARQQWIEDHKLNEDGTQLSAWYKDFMSTDASVMEGRLLGMQEILKNTRLVELRPDLQQLRVYLSERDRMRRIMDRFGYKSLSSARASWLSDEWDETVAGLKQDLAFADLYNRWLSRDDLTKARPGGGP